MTRPDSFTALIYDSALVKSVCFSVQFNFIVPKKRKTKRLFFSEIRKKKYFLSNERNGNDFQQKDIFCVNEP
jgi:hypothetical protein